MQGAGWEVGQSAHQSVPYDILVIEGGRLAHGAIAVTPAMYFHSWYVIPRYTIQL